MQRHAVHRRGHAVLADAVMDVAPGELPGVNGAMLAGLGEVRTGQVGRAADGLGQRAALTTSSAISRPCGSRPWLASSDSCALRKAAMRGRQTPGICRRCSAARSVRCGASWSSRASHALRASAPRAPTPSPGGMDRGRESTNGCVRSSRASARVRGDLVGAERRAMGLVRALLVRRAVADHRAAGDQRRLARIARAARRSRRRWPRGRGRRPRCTCQPAAAKRASWSIEVDSDGRAVDGDAVVVPQHDQPARPRWPARSIASWLMPSIRQPSPAIDIGVVVDELGAEAGRHHAFGERHADGGGDALAERAGRRLDARRVAVFGMAGGADAELAEALQLLDRHVGIADQMMERIEQHRAVAGRQHEAVAVGPVRRASGRTSGSG